MEPLLINFFMLHL